MKIKKTLYSVLAYHESDFNARGDSFEGPYEQATEWFASKEAALSRFIYQQELNNYFHPGSHIVMAGYQEMEFEVLDDLKTEIS
jgi:hypothetical protein